MPGRLIWYRTRTFSNIGMKNMMLWAIPLVFGALTARCRPTCKVVCRSSSSLQTLIPHHAPLPWILKWPLPIFVFSRHPPSAPQKWTCGFLINAASLPDYSRQRCFDVFVCIERFCQRGFLFVWGVIRDCFSPKIYETRTCRYWLESFRNASINAPLLLKLPLWSDRGCWVAKAYSPLIRYGLVW